MNCTQVKKRLTRYLERMCGNDEVAEIARHIESCPYCARELRGLQSVRGMLRCCRREKPAAVAVAEVQTAILEGTTHAHMVPGLTGKGSARRKQPRQYIAVAATLLPYLMGELGAVYGTAAGLLGAGLLWHALMVRRRRAGSEMRMFWYSIAYLFLLFLLMPLDGLLAGA